MSSEFFAMDAPHTAHWTPDSCFRAFWTVPLLHELRCKLDRTGVINAQVRPTMSSEFFTMNAPHTAHWTPDSCFRAFRTVPLLHELRCKSDRTGVINAQVRPTMSSEFFTMNAPHTAHWTPDSCFWAFRTVPLLHELRCKSGRTGVFNAQVDATKSRRNFLQQTHQIWDAPHWILSSCFWDDLDRFITERISVQIRTNLGH
jgi:hypothetical protein